MFRDPQYSSHNRVSLICNGAEYIESCCRLIATARHKVLFHTYSFSYDEVTKPFVEALLEKARQGVEVFIIIDAIGSSDIPSELRKEFAESNVHFSYFSPILSKKRHNIGRRLHQKLLLADNDLAIVGGINHSQYFIQPKDAEPWLDYAVFLEGEEVYSLQQKVRPLYDRYFPQHRALLDRLMETSRSAPNGCVLVRSNVNDFMRFKSEVYRSYILAIQKARFRVQIFATYFLPGKRLLKELKKASKRGVSVELIFGRLSDHPTEQWCSRYLYSWYLKNDIKIYVWDRSVLHGKVALIDDEWVTVGSYNHNHLSRYINLELNLEILNKPFAERVAQEFNRIKNSCDTVTEESWKSKTTFFQSFLYFSTYMMLNLITALSTVIIIRRKESEINR